MKNSNEKNKSGKREGSLNKQSEKGTHKQTQTPGQRIPSEQKK